MNYTFTIENWDTTITIETGDIEIMEKVSEAVFLALEVEDEEEEDAE